MHLDEYEVSRKISYKIFKHNGTTWNLSDYPYLDIVLNDNCNAKCKFCISHLIHDKCKADIEVFKPKIEYAISKLGVREVLLLGGEATINNDLIPMITFLKDLRLKKICLTTNGHRLATDAVYRERLIGSGITHLNLSVMSADPIVQMHISRSKIALGHQDFLAIHREAKINGVHVRINNNVFVGNHDTLDALIQFYVHVNTYCDSVKFSPLLKTDAFSTINEVTEFNRIHTLSDVQYDTLWTSVERYYHDWPLLRNPKTLGFVEYSMILLPVPIIFNYNQHGKLMQMVVNEKKVHGFKLLPTGDLSLSWNREMPQYFIA